MKEFQSLIFATFLCIAFCSYAENANSGYDYLYKNLPFDMPVVKKPVFPGKTVSIVDFGGVGNGVKLNTEAFSKAMKALSESGGGTLDVPLGVWYTGPIEFRSNINLHLEKGALLLFTDDFDAYPLVNTYFEGLETKRCQSPISGRDLENIAITGEGVINGSGESWRPLKKSKVTESYWNEVVKSGGVVINGDYWLPTDKAVRGLQLSEANLNVPRKELSPVQWDSVKDFMRPVMVSFIRCKNVMLQGVLFENSPSWNLHPLMCENLIIDNIESRNPAYAQNGDGLDIESCKNVLVVNSSFDVGDDAICIKSGKDESGRRRGMPTENVIVDNCKVFKGHGGFVVGSEMSGGVRNVYVTNCQFLGTDVGLRFKSTRGRGGVVENIFVDGISMFDIVTDSFLFDLYYGGRSATESLDEGEVHPAAGDSPPVNEGTPVFRNIYVKNIISRNARRAMFFNGLPEMNISNVHVEDVSVTARYGAELSESDGVSFKDIFISPEEGPALTLNNVRNFKLSEFTCPDSLKDIINIKGEKTKNILIDQKIDAKKIRILSKDIAREVKM